MALLPQDYSDSFSEGSWSDDFESQSIDSLESKKKPTAPSKHMSPQLHKAVVAGDEHTISRFKPELLLQVSLQGNTVAHIAARLGHLSIFLLLSKICPSLLFKPNSKGDTPLHIAARVGHLGIVKFLLDCNSGDVETGDEGAQGPQFLRMQNTNKNTALHEALQNNHGEVARLLFTAYPQLCYVVNGKGNSPASLAAEAGFLQLLEDMLVLLGDSHDLPKWKGNTPLHVAIVRKHRESLGLVLKLKPQLARATDTKGRTPLHNAAFMGYCDGLIELLEIDTQPAYQADNFGHYPIHMAVLAGHINVIKLLLEHCPGSWALLSNTGENILHLAARNGKENVVRYILKTPALEMLINERDVFGDTPLHVATKSGHSKVVCVLTRDSRVNMSIMNYNGLTALDVGEKSIHVGSVRGVLILTALRIANAPRARKEAAFAAFPAFPAFPCGVSLPRFPGHSYMDTNTVNTLILVSMLVASVTFIAGFTIPRGLNSDGPDQGMATMPTNTKFRAFVISDTIAMYCSILAVLCLAWAQLGHIPLRRSITGFTVPLLGISFSMMAVAFTAGLYIVTSTLHWLADAVLIMGIIFLICALALLFTFKMQIWSQHRFLRRISYYILYLLVSASGG